MFVTRLHTDIDVYQRFQQEYQASGQLAPSILGLCDNVDYCLPPTMCYHTFGQYRGRSVGHNGVDVVTAKGKAFRFESRYATSLERLWDFTIREVVFLGERAEVLEARQRLMGRVFALIDELGLSGWCEVGNDPFFCEPDGDASRASAQRFMELKYELRLNAGTDRSIAVGSFNFHDDFFGTRFGITLESGSPTASGCAGFGIERLVHAYACQHGADPADWPSSVSGAIRGWPGWGGTGQEWSCRS
jgi:seryl-tRNA synthetase